MMSSKNPSTLLIFLLLVSSKIFSQQTVGHFSIGFQSGVLMPLGTGLGTAPEQMGLSNGLSFKYFASEHFAMGMSLKVLNNSFKAASTANNVSISQVPITFDFEWYPTNWRLKPYIGFGAGLHFFTVSPVNGLVNTLKEIPDTYTTPAYLATGRAGLKFQVNDRFSIHGEGTIYQIAEPGDQFLWKQNDGTIYRQFKNKMSFTLGLFYHFDE
jgi:outer membrane protein W